MTGQRKSARTKFDEFLEREAPLVGMRDFVQRLPFLFYNHITNAGVSGYSPHVLRYQPRNSKGLDANGVVYCGHLIEFSAIVNVPTIITTAEAQDDAPHKYPNRNTLRALLDMKGERGEVYLAEHGARQRFSSGKLLSGQHITVAVAHLESTFKLEGSLRDYWYSFWNNVGSPLKDSLWPL